MVSTAITANKAERETSKRLAPSRWYRTVSASWAKTGIITTGSNVPVLIWSLPATGNEIIRYQGPFPYIDGLILQVTQNIGRLMVRHLPRASGRSNYTLRRLMRLWMSMFVNFSVMLLRISTIAGFVLSGLGAIGGAMVIAEAVLYSPPEAGPH